MPIGICITMKTEIMLDKAGRVVLPKPVRRQFHLAQGSTLELKVGPETIELRPRMRTPTLVEDHGLLVHEGQPTEDLLHALETSRQRRNRDIAEIW
jgi:AbrB family looped-hinge helix DNA binding protein